MEVNRKLNKAERDRQVGQCAGYSREWVNLGCIDRHACSPRAGIGRASRRQGTGAHLGVFVFFNALVGLLPLAGSGGGR